ncbi:hypothetical protein [Shewanella chilikensis]|uniref:hypothetical protein n=1 Tax=Shewanella chilikensis TaxID=558541 RepID=UPI00399BA493
MQGFKGFLLSSLLALLVGCSWAALAGIVGLLLLPSMFQSKGWLDLTYMLVGTILMLQALIAGCWAGWLRGSGVLIRQTVTQNAFWKTNLFIAIGILPLVYCYCLRYCISFLYPPRLTLVIEWTVNTRLKYPPNSDNKCTTHG